MCFMHDGVPAHFLRIIREHLNKNFEWNTVHLI